MSEEVLIPKMKRLDRKQKRIRRPFINFALIVFSVLLIVCATFVNIEFKHYIIPADIFSNNQLEKENFIRSFSIIPQIPVIMFICSSIGKKMTISAVCLYILIGLFLFPVFALGGGIQYFTEYSFGYILAYLPAVIILGNFLNKKYSFFNIFIGTILAVLLIHFCGIMYMIIVALFKHSGIDFIKSWIVAQSGIKILYDLVISFVLVLIGKYIHSFIKYITD